MVLSADANVTVIVFIGQVIISRQNLADFVVDFHGDVGKC